MKIGIPKEIKTKESRVAMTPAGVMELTHRGHEIYVQKGAGLESKFSNEQYIEAGATLLDTIEEVYHVADMIVKVKEPIESEYALLKKGQILFTFLHLASSKILTEAMIRSGAVCIAYETVVTKDRQLPLLTPMSEVAGRSSIQQGAKYLEKPQGGKGILLGGVPGVRPANVLILGGGVVGTQAAYMAAGLGANVTILDINLNRLRYLADVMPANVTTQFSNKHAITELLPSADLVIGAVLVPGAAAPKLIKRDYLKNMRPGSVIVDVAVDQGGCCETTRPTYHDDPTFVVDGVIHYCVANMPGAVSQTSTYALTNSTLNYGLKIANMGLEQAIATDDGLKLGVNCYQGYLTCEEVAHDFGMEYTNIDSLV